MMPFDIDWPYVRRHTLRPALSALVALVSLAIAIWLHDRQERRYDELSVNHNAVHEDYDTLVYQRRLVDRYHRRYERFHNLGFVGRESRLDWVETLRAASNALNVPRVNYSIEPQLEVIPPVNSVSGGEKIQLRASKVQLEMGLLHEYDLLRFFDTLQVSAPGLLKVDKCNLAWRTAVGAHASTDVNLSASCEIQLYSVITSDVSTDRSYPEAAAYE
jgi:hypothetical protein